MNKIIGLDLIRFICAIWVVFAHFGMPPILKGLFRIDTAKGWAHIVDTGYNLTTSGASAVIVFFVISGFCIHYPQRMGKSLNLDSYYSRRYIRIGVPMLAAMGINLLIGQDLGLQLTSASSSVLWSVYAEIIYYTIYPLLLCLRQKYSWEKLIGFSLVVSYLIVFFMDAKAGNYSSYGLLFSWMVGLPSWLLGCRLAEVYVRPPRLAIANIWHLRLLTWVLSSVCVVLHCHSPIRLPLTLNLFAIVVAIWLHAEVRHSKAHLAAHPLFSLLESAGTWSYSLYLMHAPAAYIFKEYIYHLDLGVFLNWLCLMVFILTLSYLFYVLVERPAHRLARKFKTRLPAEA
jgi:peptidoglycan/LPS O-acetylase OafA/YrhL